MKKVIVLLFGTSLLGFSFHGLLSDSYYIQVLMNTDAPFMYARVALVTSLCVYVFVHGVRLNTTKSFVSASGILMLSFGMVSLASPTILGQVNTYILLVDSLTLINGGILAIILSIELPVHRPRSMVIAQYYKGLLPSYLLKELAYTSMKTDRNIAVSTQSLNGGKAFTSLVTRQLIRRSTVDNKV